MRGRAISRDELLNEVWGYENYPCTRTVDNHILKLRPKLENDPANPALLVTMHGLGYNSFLSSLCDYRVAHTHKSESSSPGVEDQSIWCKVA